jgi:PAS domain S-box-containing protein
LVSAFTLLLSWLLGPLVELADFPFLLAAVMFSAWYGGLGPGLLATAVGMLASTLFLSPTQVATNDSLGAAVRLGVFVLEALVISSLSAALHAAQQRAKALLTSEQVAHAEAEATTRRLRQLQSVTDTALAHLRLDELLRELSGRIRDALAADTVVILLLTEDESQLAVRAAWGLEEEVARGIRIPVGRGIAGRIATEREPVILQNLSSVEIASPVLRQKGLHALLGVPLVVEGRLIGVVHVGTLRPHSFSEDETRLLRLVADRIAIAIDHARLYEAERFRLLVDGVGEYALNMLDHDGRVASWNAGAQRLKGYTADEVIGRHFSMFYSPEDVRDGAPREALAGAAGEGRYERECWRVRKDGSRFWANVVVTALRDGGEALIGFATLTHDLTARRQMAETRTRLLEQLISAQEEEQRRIARELHDETGQSLTSLLVGLRALEDSRSLEEARTRVGELRQITARALDEVRRLAWGLRPVALDELGLVAALEQYAAEYARSWGLAVDVEARGLNSDRLPAPVETALYRIVQEALTNSAKHAGAQKVNVVIQRHAASVQVIVVDDGCGFDAEAALKPGGPGTRLGLHGMRERAILLNGSVTIESAPGEGTTVYAWIPLSETHDAGHSGSDRG